VLGEVKFDKYYCGEIERVGFVPRSEWQMSLDSSSSEKSMSIMDGMNGFLVLLGSSIS